MKWPPWQGISAAAPSAPVDAAEAWKAVGLVNDWVKHAETKAAATLAAAGVSGGVLYNLVKDQRDGGVILAITATVCGALVVLAGVFAVLALWPRLRADEPPTSRLYFDHIARRHPSGPDGYISELKQLVADPDALLDQLGQQIWANARVARGKYQWAGRALIALVWAFAALGGTALNLALVSIGVGDGQ